MQVNRTPNTTCDQCGRGYYRAPYETSQKNTCSKACMLASKRHADVRVLDDGTVEVPLTRGMVALIDGDDADRVLAYPWYAASCDGQYYATNDTAGLLHRFLMEPKPGMLVDHINGDKLDNRRCNLRIATPSQNAMNSAKRRTSKGKYRGVSKNGPGWSAMLTKDYKSHYLGTFRTPEEAAKAYDEMARILHGEFAVLNFPKEE